MKSLIRRSAVLGAVSILALTSQSIFAQTRVAVEDGSGNGSGAGLVTQLNDDTWADFTATLVTAADIDSMAELANYDVVVLGGSGHNDADWTLDMANALFQFVTAGGGAVLTGWGNYDMQSSDPVSDVLEGIFPTQNIDSTNDFDDSGATLVITQAHPITNGLSDFVIASGCCTELNPLPLETGDTVLATMDGNNSGAGSTAVATKNVGSGFGVYLGPVYMGSETTYDSMFPALREGNPDQLLEQAVAWAGSGEVVAPPDVAGFTVTKTFSDGNDADVDVSISCNDGFVNANTTTITGDGVDSFRFIVTDFISGSMDCEITESSTPGYSTDSCSFTDVVGGEYSCALSNDAEDAMFTVNKVWDQSGAVGDEVDQTAIITIMCSNPITDVDGGLPVEPLLQAVNGGFYETRQLVGDGSIVVTVDTTLSSAICSASEFIETSGVESEDDCEARTIDAGGMSECTFTNTVFFEGIPTLSQYGLALMALLMLGMGMVGFRRFA